LVLDSKDSSPSEVDNRLRKFEAYIALTTHDLAEPLRTIGVFAEMLASRQPNDEKSVSLIAQIGSGVERMRSLISDLLAYARLPETPVKREETDLNEPLHSALMNLQASITETGATVRCETLPRVSGDASHLTQLFQNLISNSLKYSRPGIPPLIEIGAEDTDNPLECLLYVRDNGQGFSLELAESVFEPFRRLHSRTTPGTGIGLSICKRIAERHGGRIWATSEKGNGSTFRFTLPRWQPASESDRAKAVQVSE